MSRRSFLAIILGVVVAANFFGCKKRQPATEEQISMEDLGIPQVTPPQPAQVTTPTQPEVKLETLPPGPYKPTAQEIQTALKKANFYAGEVDGKIGPQTKKAVEDFQRANGLKVDGKVGPKTWAKLSAYLNPSAPATSQEKNKP
jgi:murein L,D-transpeptidase YcbB/YkuD